jgi:GAF domain-containing protein
MREERRWITMPHRSSPRSDHDPLPAPGRKANEAVRQAAVDRTGIVKRRGEPILQHIVEQAARDYGVPVALISIVDRRREFFAARTGTDEDEIPRKNALCLHAVKCPGEPVIAIDARTDRRFAANPCVTGPPYVRFYAGVPLLDRAGYALGALCVIDTKPRDSAPSLFNLIRLAREAERMIDR